jgi:hypothetical protein
MISRYPRQIEVVKPIYAQQAIILRTAHGQIAQTRSPLHGTSLNPIAPMVMGTGSFLHGT